jgi:hypothetical protein
MSSQLCLLNYQFSYKALLLFGSDVLSDFEQKFLGYFSNSRTLQAGFLLEKKLTFYIDPETIQNPECRKFLDQILEKKKNYPEIQSLCNPG